VSANDDKILKLKAQIEEKKKKIGAKFTPVTNCSITVGEKRINIHTLNSVSAIHELLILINSMYLSAKDLGIEEEHLHCGYKLGDWLTDLKAKLMVVNEKAEAKKLKDMEDKLSTLLSEDKKTELELDSIEKELGL
jgi:hypothetical protein